MIRVCKWCDRTIGPKARRDSIYCSKRCRQSAWRFTRGCKSRTATRSPLRLGYADPPYPGLARRYYADHPDYAGEVDHVELVATLRRDFPDGWALSTSADALPRVINFCLDAGAPVSVGAWFRGERPNVSARPLSSWEPVIYCGGRVYESPLQDRRLDALVYPARPRRSDPHRVIGAKPAEFCWWVFDLLGALPGDEWIDLFPGSGGIARAWAIYCEREASSVDGRRVAEGLRDDEPSRLPGHDASCSAESRRLRAADQIDRDAADDGREHDRRQ